MSDPALRDALSSRTAAHQSGRTKVLENLVAMSNVEPGALSSGHGVWAIWLLLFSLVAGASDARGMPARDGPAGRPLSLSSSGRGRPAPARLTMPGRHP